ncbi:MAG TPA: type II toxin-antitoxin system HicA family toxin [Acetobacteraceae bacterium]|nr:type II toxin-antitoxin system HicA family toxin [Acetobacteraceae bacterium]
MKPVELLRRLTRIATSRGWEIVVTEGRGHTKVRCNGRRSAIPRHASDIKSGTLHAILKQLDLTKDDLEI